MFYFYFVIYIIHVYGKSIHVNYYLSFIHSVHSMQYPVRYSTTIAKNHRRLDQAKK